MFVVKTLQQQEIPVCQFADRSENREVVQLPVHDQHYLNCMYMFKCTKFIMEHPAPSIALQAIIKVLQVQQLFLVEMMQVYDKEKNLFECTAVILYKLEDIYESCHGEVYLF